MSKPLYYILEADHSFRPAKTNEEYYEWSKQMGIVRVGLTNIDKDTYVSTIFLGLDHSFQSDTPVLFETMIFGGEHDQYQERDYLWDEAVKRHLECIDMIRNTAVKNATT